MHTETVQLSITGSTAAVMLSRPEVLNAANAQWMQDLNDLTQTPNAGDAGIHKSLVEQIGAGRRDGGGRWRGALHAARPP
jgi:hypothetical protein